MKLPARAAPPAGSPQAGPLAAEPPAERPATIPRKQRAARGGSTDSDVSFESLREQGVRLAQALSGDIWTDYNLHDPGVTILEQLCYALTDLTYRVDFPVADHLQARDQDGIDYAGLSLHTPSEALPCRATSATDYRRVLLDQVPGLDDATFDATPSTAAASETIRDRRGLYRLELKLSQGEVMGEDLRVPQARAAYRARRNLCEDIELEIRKIDDDWCDLQLDVELSGPRDAVDVLADIYERCAVHIAQGLRFHSGGELLAQDHTLEQIYTGPITEQGFASDTDAAPAELLFVSDLATIAKGVDGVRELRALSLRRDGDASSSSALRFRSGSDNSGDNGSDNNGHDSGNNKALRLRVPGVTLGARSALEVQALLKREVRLRRSGSLITVSAVELGNRLADLYAAGRSRRHGHDASEVVELPRGQYRDMLRYASVQDGFPAVYGLGHRGMPASATPQEKAQALQLQTYLLLFEQVMANSVAQIEHLRDLFSSRNAKGPSYWWQLLGDATVPGVDATYLPPPGEPPFHATASAEPKSWSTEALRAQVVADVYEARDPQADRKSRVFDHLLALHGETYTQNSMRQFCNYLSPSELEAALLDNKAAFLKDIVSLTRDRAAGLNYALPSWGQPGGGTGLQRRVSHLLGFRHAHSRSLTQPVERQKRSLLPINDDPTLGAVSHVGDTHAARPHPQPLNQIEVRADLAQMKPLRHAQLSEAMLRCGTSRDRYRLSGPPCDNAGLVPAQGTQQLLLGPDEHGRWWPLAEFSTPEAAARAAESMRRLLLVLNHDTEGLHVVEHVLLRPVGNSSEHAALRGLPADFYALRLTAVFPAWTVRTAQANFQRFAADTVQLNCPAHVAADCLWLGYEAMLHFESCYAEWLQAKLDFCAATERAFDESSAEPQAAQRLNRAACAVIACLYKAKAPGPYAPSDTNGDADLDTSASANG